MKSLTVVVTLTAALTATATAAAAQGRPADFRVRYDRANAVDSTFAFEVMRPGWHVTSGPSAIVYQPSLSGTGRYRAETMIHLFPRAGHAEGVGLIVGGQNLDAATQRYVYFLIRKDGQFLIKERTGAQTRDLVPWTAHAAIVPQPGTDSSASSVRNTLAVEAGADSVEFFVNGQRVHTLPRGAAGFDGIVGLRVNHNVNIHVQTLSVTAR